MKDYPSVYDVLKYMLDSYPNSVNVNDLSFFVLNNSDRIIHDMVDRSLIEPDDSVPIGELDFGKTIEFVPVSYKLTAKGLSEAQIIQRREYEMAKYISDNQAKEQRMSVERSADIRREYILFFLGLLLGWILGAITPVDVWAWIMSLFH